MPYPTNASVPDDVKRRFKGHCLTVWREVWNETFERHNDEGRAFGSAEKAAQNCTSSTKSAEVPIMDMAVKRVGDTIEGLAIPYGTDVDGESFTPQTDLCLDWFGKSGRPLIYDHGLDKGPGPSVIGRQLDLEERDEGIWVKSQLDMAHRYRKAVDKLIDEGALGYSSGAMQHLAVKNKRTNEITRWPWVELSLTPIPAHLGAMVHYVKSADAIRHLEAVEMDVPSPLKAALVALDEWADSRDAAPGSEPFTDRLVRVSDEVRGLTGHATQYAEMRTKAGRVISAANRGRLASARDGLREVADLLEALLVETDPEAKEAGKAALLRAVLEAELRANPLAPQLPPMT